MTGLRACFLLVLPMVAGYAKPAITDVFNAANRIQRALPGHGVAQGALFAVKGTDLGPTELVKATFPLPTADGLGGVTITVQVGDTTVNGILVLASATEVDAILPSNTPLGEGTVTLTFNGESATGQIVVVASAFGLFSIDFFSGLQQTASFNVMGDGSTVANDILHAASPGQVMRLIGTGLGAIASDETSPGATDVPTTPELKLFIGSKQAELRSASRGDCCDGLPEAFPLPRGLAAIDVLEFVIPDGVLGCHTSIALQAGKLVSNIAQIAIQDSDATACTDPNAVGNGETVTVTGTGTVGNINMMQVVTRATTGPTTAEIGTEVGTAQFVRFDTGVSDPITLQVAQWGYLANNLNPGSCTQLLYRVKAQQTEPPVPAPPVMNKPVFLDAGDPINLKNATVTKTLRRGRDLTYSGSLASTFSIPGLPITASAFMTPGEIKADNGAGGPDIPGFQVSLTLPTALKFVNIDELATINRADGVTVTWSGGDPNGFVTVIGTSTAYDGDYVLGSTFSCTERNSAGQIAVPPVITLGMVPTGSVGQVGSNGLGTISLQTYVAKKVDVPKTDFSIFSAVTLLARSAVYR